MLQGSLENFALDEVLGLLSSTSKTGQLDIKGDRGSGALMFREGRLVDGTASFTANGTGIEDVMFELLRYSEGSFTFTAREVEATEYEENVVSVLSGAEKRLLDWRAIESVVPSLSHVVTPAADLPADEVTITRDEWSALTTIGAGCPASTVCERLQLGEVEGSRQIKNLAERQLVVIGDSGGFGGLKSRPPAAHSQASPPPALAGYPTPEPVGADDEVIADRPPMPPPPSMDDLAPPPPPMDDVAPPPSSDDLAPPSPAEIAEFGDVLNDASELLDEPKDGNGLLMQYIKGEE